MEDYETIKKLDKGGQGEVFLVKNVKNGKTYVMKKIDSKSEREANKAVNEANSLKDLLHPYICGYKEFFLNWIPEIRSLTVCIVMDYYECGDLQNYIDSMRKNKKAIKEEIIKKWLGQIIEVLTFIHKKGVIHRDLKPSNIFLKDKSVDIVVGDFGVATVMGDFDLKTRTVVGSQMWMAPEITKRPYDIRSDVWSVGAIFVHLMTCQAYDENELRAIFHNFVHGHGSLEDLLKTISKTYSKELVLVIRQMLRKEFEQRPTAEELSKIPIVSQCMAAANPANRKPGKDESVKSETKPIPINEGVNGVIKFINVEKQNENCVKAALQWISQQDGLSLNNDAEMVVASMMTDHVVSEDVCRYGMKIFSMLSKKVRKTDAMFTKEILTPVVGAVKAHGRCVDIQENFISFLISFSTYENAPVPLGNVGSIQCVLDAMRTFPGDENMTANACQALWSLCTEESNKRIAATEGAFTTVCAAMKAYSSSSNVLKHAVSAMYPLVDDDDAMDLVKEENLIYLLLSCMKTFIGNSDLINYCLLVVSSLVEDETIAAEFIKCQGGNPPAAIEGISLLRAIYDVHKDNVTVVQSVCEVLNLLLQHDDIASSVKNDDVLMQVLKKY